MSAISPHGRKAIEQARQGDIAGALATAKEAISYDPHDQGLRFFAAMLHSRRSELAEAAAEFREVLRLADDPFVRAELIRVVVGMGELEEAEALLAKPGIPDQDSARLRALLCVRRGDHAGAAALYQQIVQREPRDFESWGNLGVSLLVLGEAARAVAALERALQLRPLQSKFGDKWAEAHAGAGTADAALSDLYDQDDPAALISAARLEDLQGRPDQAMAALGRVLDADPANVSALILLADLQERRNEIGAFESTLDTLERVSPAEPKLPLLRARAAFRRGNDDLAAKFAQQARAVSGDPAAAAQIIARIRDRLGEWGAAFAAAEEMNRLDSQFAANPTATAEGYRARLRERAAILTPDWVARWHAVPAPRIQPAFLVGFPRSGTTLLDTLLANAGEIAVSEENLMLDQVSGLVGGFDRIADVDARAVAELRRAYFAEVARQVPESDGRLLLDKFPFGMGGAPLIYRLFPTAPILFLARHPCDVVLSCFMTRFQPTEIGSAFLSLEGTARLYDAMMQLWTRSRELLPLQILDLRYETLVADPENEMRRVADFLGIAWSNDLVDNLAAASRRGFIKTPSYSQVAEPIHNRAVERWRNYEAQLAPVMSILEPWIELLGYES